MDTPLDQSNDFSTMCITKIKSKSKKQWKKNINKKRNNIRK